MYIETINNGSHTFKVGESVGARVVYKEKKATLIMVLYDKVDEDIFFIGTCLKNAASNEIVQFSSLLKNET